MYYIRKTVTNVSFIDGTIDTFGYVERANDNTYPAEHKADTGAWEVTKNPADDDLPEIDDGSGSGSGGGSN